MTDNDRLRALVESIEANLKSASTITAQTLHNLRSLLAVDADKTEIKSTSEISRTSDRTKKPISKPAKPIRSTGRTTKKAQDFDIYEAPDCAISPLPITKRRKLATDTFNTTLKCLATTAKEKQSLATTVPSTTNKLSSRAKAKGAKPLAPCSPNRQTKHNISSCIRSAEEESLDLVADCAAAALDCLRDLEAGGSKQKSSNTLQQEQGALVLLDKLIGLELIEHASTQAGRIYEQYWKRRKDDAGSTIPQRKLQQLNLSDFIRMQLVPEEKVDYNFLTSYQSQVLRLAILRGPGVITDSFVQNVSIHSLGSPASLVLQGMELGFLDHEKTGLQMRTISLVLLKLYSKGVSDQDRSTICPYVLLDLLVQSLVIKCSSWLHLRHDPDLERELWILMLHGARRLVKSKNSEQTKVFKSLQGHLDTITCALKENRFDAVPAPEFVLLLSEVGEKAGNFMGVFQVLNTCNDSEDKPVTAKAVILLWQKAIIEMKSSSKQSATALLCQEQALSSLQFQGTIEDNEIEDLLVYGARLRKSFLCNVSEIEDSLDKSSAEDMDSKSELCCARFLLKFLVFLSKHLAHRLDDPISNTVHQSRRRALVTSFAKSVESVLALETFKISKTLLQREYDEAMEQCIVLSHTLQSKIQFLSEDALTAFVQGLPVRISNLFWSRYTQGLGACLADAELTCCLKQSVAAVQNCPPYIQRTASLGMKLEKLALIHLQAKNAEAARQYFEDAIIHYIQIGAVADAVEIALSRSSIKTWSTPSSKTYALGKALSSHGKLSLTHNLVSTGSAMWFYNDESLPEIHQCVLLEHQILSCLDQPSITTEQCDAVKTCVQNILSSCQDPRYNTYRARFILRLLKATADSSSSVVSQTVSDEFVDQLIQGECSDFLSKYHESIRHCLGIEWILWNGRNNIEALLQHVKGLSAFLVGLSDVDALESSVDDIEFCFNQLRSVASYARFIDNIELATQALIALKQMIVLRLGQSHNSLLPYLTQIGSLQNRAGMISEAAKIFAAGQEIFDTILEPSCTEIRWMLAYVEHLMDIGNISKVEEMLKRAHTTFLTCYGAAEHLASRTRLDRDSLLSWAACIASRLAFQNGNLVGATRYAIQAFKISAAIWKAIEQPTASSNGDSTLAKNGSTMDLLSSEMSGLTLSSRNTISQHQTRGSAFWNFADLHFGSLANLTSVSSHNGSYQDALQYGQLLRKVAQSIGSSAWEVRAASLLAAVHGKAGHSEEAMMLLQVLPSDLATISNLQRAEIGTLHVEALLETGSVEQAANLLSVLKQLSFAQEQTNALKKPLKSVTNGCDRPPLRGKTKTVRLIKKPAKHPVQRRLPTSNPVSLEKPQTACSRLERFKERVHVLYNMAYLAEIEDSDRSESRTHAESVPAALHSIDSRVTSSMVMLHKGLHELASDPVKCVLAETAVALPVRYKSSRKSGRVTLLKVDDPPAALEARKTARTRAPPKSIEAPTQTITSGEKLLLEAQDTLQMISSDQANLCPSDMLHIAGKIKSKLALLSSTIDGPSNMTSLQLVQQSISPKDVVLSRERLAIKAEKFNHEGGQVFAWPEIVLDPHREDGSQSFDTDLLADIPESWSIVSLSLADDQQEMLVSKITADRSPFLLRIPLSRPDIESEELDEFSFQEAIAELHDIIDKANTSCHDKRGQGNKESRLEWYAERQALDKRLETLLKNVENIWLGGFRGLMTAERISEEVLSKFGQMLSQVLEQHLPSRQKLAKNSPTKVELHDHVLELFLGLGNPDEQDMDDAITDLLYFVVDILQFSGERNAYDEIDFDAMLVEILDSLRSCHDLMQNESNLSPSHTILIVDKELASIPWESLPCMQTQSVSRMPSLSAILERLRKIREQNISEDGYSLATIQGAYMLNPSSDLVSTQSVFQPILQTHLPDYTAKINKAPTESEFEATLHDNDLFLYFGHGAGAQYIRGRRIRSLDKCAVTLLMGCSSAKMTECGKYESYGMPGYYINGLSGCMAVVGTLWDVTDRDIDRFALRLMVEWGLIPEDELVSKALEKPRKKGQSKVASGGVNEKGELRGEERMRNKKGKIGLDEAVRKGRDACALKYLNGAAPVVYGIPVFLG